MTQVEKQQNVVVAKRPSLLDLIHQQVNSALHRLIEALKKQIVRRHKDDENKKAE